MLWTQTIKSFFIFQGLISIPKNTTLLEFLYHYRIKKANADMKKYEIIVLLVNNFGVRLGGKDITINEENNVLRLPHPMYF